MELLNCGDWNADKTRRKQAGIMKRGRCEILFHPVEFRMHLSTTYQRDLIAGVPVARPRMLT